MKTSPLHIILSLFLIVSFSWQCCARSAIYLHYQLNKKEIAETLCVNKAKPKSCCEGKCYLDKELKKEEKRQSDLPAAIKDKSEKSPNTLIVLKHLPLTACFIQELAFPYQQAQSHPAPSDIFHPPSVC